MCYLKLKLTTKKRFSICIMHYYFEMDDPLLIPGLNFCCIIFTIPNNNFYYIFVHDLHHKVAYPLQHAVVVRIVGLVLWTLLL